VVAGISFILPATLMVAAVAWGYVRYGSLPEVTAILYGIKPVVIAIIGQALWALGRAALKTRGLAILGVSCLAALAAGVHELWVLVGAGLVTAIARGSVRWRRMIAGLVVGAGAAAGGVLSAVAAGTAPAVAPFGLWPLFLVFARLGAVLFGSGYVLLALLRAEIVERLRWISETQLLDATAVGQMTPGPVLTTATFIGYVLGGLAGAAVATLGIFLPAFVFVALSGPLVPRLRGSPHAAAVLDGVNVASLALMALVAWHLGRAALVDPITVAVTFLSLVALTRYHVNSVWLIVTAGLIGWLART
jgi:chromate transporter